MNIILKKLIYTQYINIYIEYIKDIVNKNFKFAKIIISVGDSLKNISFFIFICII